MYLQQVKNCTLSQFDDKRCYINNNESVPWGKNDKFQIDSPLILLVLEFF